MQKYIEKLKTSSEFRNKMLLNFETGYRCGLRAPSSYLAPNTFFDVKFARDSDSVVSVLVKKFVKEKLVDEKSFLAIYYEGYYYAVPKSLAPAMYVTIDVLEEDECPVCLDDYIPIIKSLCGHHACQSCCRSMKATGRTICCPLCRDSRFKAICTR